MANRLRSVISLPPAEGVLWTDAFLRLTYPWS